MRAALGMVVMLLALSGCASKSESEMDAACSAATRTLKAYMAALKDGDCKKAYDCLSWKRRKEITLAEVEADYAAHRDRYHYRAQSRIERPLYDDFRVVAKLVDGDGNVEFVALVPEDGAWKIEASGRNYPEVYRRVQGGPGGTP